ncbi:MAG: hypothetical protein FD153_429 [Rhodospirillaceae bacterium]|nr:MAG: hypothetical protein FD153_429 [Rhodospirillaceae bacterium]
MPAAEPAARRYVSNEDILNTLLAMTEGIETLVVETMAVERKANSWAETASSFEDIRIIVAQAVIADG